MAVRLTNIGSIYNGPIHRSAVFFSLALRDHGMILSYLSHPPLHHCCTFRTLSDIPTTSMSIGFQADSSAVGLSESVGLTFVARNDSSAEVNSINVEIKQVRSQYSFAVVLSKCGELHLLHPDIEVHILQLTNPFGQAQRGCSP